jgi:hypothetical protein
LGDFLLSAFQANVAAWFVTLTSDLLDPELFVGFLGRFSPLPNLNVLSIPLSLWGLGLLDDFFDDGDVFPCGVRLSEPEFGIPAARSAASFETEELEEVRPTATRSGIFLGGTGGLEDEPGREMPG